MDGIIILDKPTGKTSQQIVQIIKQKIGAKKVGHAGTLDPLATGLLIILIDKATKLSNVFLNQDKIYEVEAQLFIETDTDDITGKIIKNGNPVSFSQKQVISAIQQFNNLSYWQKPPLYSAIKIKGKELYKYARKGIKIEVPTRLVKLKKIELLNYSSEKLNLLVECSKGTYIRSLIKDIAEKLGTIATVSNLRRISSGNFHINEAISLDKVRIEKIIPLANLIASLARKE